MGHIREIVFNCENPALLARFWADALDGYAVRAQDAAEMERLEAFGFPAEAEPVVHADGPGPTLCFQNIPGQSRENNRVHLDIATADRPGQVERLRALGAELVDTLPGHCVMRDPEANQFCVIDSEPGQAAA